MVVSFCLIFFRRELCLDPSTDVSRVATHVRGDGPTFRFHKRHYRVLETLALPGEEEGPVSPREILVGV